MRMASPHEPTRALRCTLAACAALLASCGSNEAPRETERQDTVQAPQVERPAKPSSAAPSEAARRASADAALVARARRLHPGVANAILYSSVEWCNRPSADLPGDVLDTLMSMNVVPYVGPMERPEGTPIEGHWFDAAAGTTYVDVRFIRSLLDSDAPAGAARTGVIVSLAYGLADAVLATRGASDDRRAELAGAITRRIIMKPEQEPEFDAPELTRSFAAIDRVVAGMGSAPRSPLSFPADERASEAERFLAGMREPGVAAAPR